MRYHKCFINIFGTITIISFAACMYIHYFATCKESEFWVNIFLGIFGSSLLTSISSIISYLIARKETLERFNVYIRQILQFLSKYQRSWEIDKKINFLISYLELDKNLCWTELRNIDFWSEKYTKNRNYIANYIYDPICQLEQQIQAHEENFRRYLDHKDCSCDGEVSEQDKELDDEYEKSYEMQMKQYIYGIENKLFNHYLDSGRKITLVKSILNELEGQYLKITYGKKFRQKGE